MKKENILKYVLHVLGRTVALWMRVVCNAITFLQYTITFTNKMLINKNKWEKRSCMKGKQVHEYIRRQKVPYPLHIHFIACV